MPAARRRPRQPRRKLKQRVPSRAARYARSVRPADGAELRFRLLLRRLVAKWWAKIGPQALAKAKQIAKPEARSDAEEEASDGSPAVSLTDYSSEASASWFGAGVGNVAQDVNRHGANELGRIGVKLSKAASIRLEPRVSKLLPEWRKENVGLVRTMLDKEKAKLESLLKDGAGRRYETLARDIKERLGITTRHAELIARDQTSKLNARITQQRMAAAGITSYRWTTAGDERVRPTHDELDGEEFDFDDPPVTNDDGDTNNPGEDYQCRCVAFPILPELGEEDEEPAEDEPEAGDQAPDDLEPEPPSASEPDEQEPPSAPFVPAPVDPENLPPAVDVDPSGRTAKLAERDPHRVAVFVDRSRYAAAAVRTAGDHAAEAVRAYTGSAYGPLNEALRHNGELSDRLKDVARGTSEGLRAAQAAGAGLPGTTYRGLDIADVPDFLSKLGSPGSVWSPAEFLSTTITPETAEDFTGYGERRVMLEISGRTGVPLANLSGFGADEGEVLFDRAGRFKVESIVKDENGGHHIKLREVR